MKKRIGISVVVAGIIAHPAYARSQVTLYGVADDGFSFTNNQGGGHAYQMVNGALGSSKFGFLVKEDIGNGYKVISVLENGFDINSGKLNNGGRLFGRQAYVGVDGPYGQVRLGRQYDLVLDSLIPLASGAKFGGILAPRAGDVDNAWGDYSFSNSIKYLSPSLGGVRLGALVSLGGVSGDFGNGLKYSFNAGYTGGPVTINAVFSRVNNPATSIYDATASPTENGTFANPITNPIYSGYVSARRYQTIGAGGNLVLGDATVGVVYTNVQFIDVVRTSSTPFSGTAHFNTTEVNATYRITPALLVGSSYSFTFAGNADYGQLNAGAQYSLSKRTNLYLVSAWQHAIGTNSLGKRAVAALTFVSPSSNQNQVAVRLGIRQTF
jgi:predicted porin